MNSATESDNFVKRLLNGYPSILIYTYQIASVICIIKLHIDVSVKLMSDEFYQTKGKWQLSNYFCQKDVRFLSNETR